MIARVALVIFKRHQTPNQTVSPPSSRRDHRTGFRRGPAWYIALAGLVGGFVSIPFIARRDVAGFAILLSLLFVSGCQRPPSATMPDSAAPPIQASDTPHREAAKFCEPIELVLAMESMHFMLDLDTGKTMDAPARNRPGQETMDVHPNQQQPYEQPDALSCESLFLIGTPLRGMKVPSNQWNATESELQTELASDKVQSLDQMPCEPGESATYFFVTHGGTHGILQLTAVEDDPPGLRIRYQVLEPAPREPE